MSLLYVIGIILGVTGLMRLGGYSKSGNNGAMPTAKVGDEYTERKRTLSTNDVEKGESIVLIVRHSNNNVLIKIHN
jgi:hypothetical protein